MKTGKIQLSDKEKISKILNKNNYLLIIVGIICLIINFDLFNSHPKFLVTDGYLWKGFAIVFQLTFIYSIIKWESKKQLIIDILSNGVIVIGDLKISERVKASSTSYFYLHLFEYYVSDIKYEITLKNKKDSVKSNYIIYQSDNPQKGIVYEDLKSGLKTMIKEKLKKE